MTNNALTTIPLDRLARHPSNVRKTSATGIAELAASIERDGLLQNLTVVQLDGSAMHEVVAGGRRLAALNLLAKQGKIAQDFAVPVRLVDPADAESVSLVENQMREAMHPIDQFEAFKAQIDAGNPLADVAARFGVTETFVKQRLKLAAVSPVVIDAYRAGKMTLEQLQAFTVTDDQARQEEVWEEIKDSRWGNDPDEIKGELLEDTVSTKDARLKFVGLKNYQKAGGAVIKADLFSEDATETLSDPELVNRLALEKLQKQADKLRKDEGLAWCDAMITASYSEINSKYGKVPTIVRDLTEAEAAEYREIETKLEALQKQLDAVQESDDPDYAEEERLIKEMEPLDERRDAIDEACSGPHPDAIEYTGAVVCIDYSGKLEIKRNLIRQADMKKLKPIAKQEGGEGSAGTGSAQAEKPAPSHSEKLMRRMTANKTAILRHAIVQRPNDSLAVVVLHMLAEDLRREPHRGLIGDEPLTMRTTDRENLKAADENIENSEVMQQFRLLEDAWMAPVREYLEKTKGKGLYGYLCSQPHEYLLQLLSLCVARRTSLMESKEGDKYSTSANIEADYLNDEYVSRFWKPTRANYLDHVSRQQIIGAVQEAVTIEASEPLFPMKKAQAAEYAEGLLVASDWLPLPMRVQS